MTTILHSHQGSVNHHPERWQLSRVILPPPSPSSVSQLMGTSTGLSWGKARRFHMPRWTDCADTGILRVFCMSIFGFQEGGQLVCFKETDGKLCLGLRSRTVVPRTMVDLRKSAERFQLRASVPTTHEIPSKALFHTYFPCCIRKMGHDAPHHFTHRGRANGYRRF